ncbi:MAG TPA: acyltransferase family protein [Solirubrobacterales bacterium]|nr:acyltransferase family protein [Solirubrobacterales bacterium]
MNSRGFRLDLQGVRGLALVLVLACHAELPGAAGGYVGLDVFFVLSGFLITGLILGEIDRRGSVSISRFYARRAKRLLPLAVTVLVATMIGSVLLLSPLQSEEVAGDVLAAALYFVNWHFIAESVDYFAFSETLTSPVQHYWSLSVEEQFYLLWPLLLGAAAALARWRLWSMRATIAVLVIPIAIASLLYSLQFTPADPRAAYFSSLTRFWELALGGTLALVLPARLRLPRFASALLAGGGMAVLLATCIAFSAGTPYPGWRALLPVAATLAIIVAGTASALSKPVSLLTLAPMQFLGKISYAWYLWHWPVIVFAGVILGALSPLGLVVATLASGVLAVLTHYAIEEPFRRSRALNQRPGRALAVGLTCTVAAVVLALGLQSSRSTLPTAPPSRALGAEVVGPENPQQESVEAVRPNPAAAGSDKGPLWAEECVLVKDATEPPNCSTGRGDAKATVVLFGDSHALQWSPALLRVAEKKDWRVVSMVKAGCVIAEVSYERSCDVWRFKAMRRIVRQVQPDLVVVSSSTGSRYEIVHAGQRLSREESQPHLIAGFALTLQRLKQTGAKVAVIRDQQLAPFSPPDCVSDHHDELNRCTFPSRRSRADAFDAFGAARAGARLIDPVRVLCPRRRCRSVIGNVLVYRDSYHLSATFARSLAPWLERELPAPRGS